MNHPDQLNDPFDNPHVGSFAAAPPQPTYSSAAPYGNYNRYGMSPYPTPSGYSSGYGIGYGSGMYGAGTAYPAYNTAHGGSYGPPGRATSFGGAAGHVETGGAAVISGIQEAMQRFARVSGLLEEILRNLHLLFDGVFGLGYSVAGFYDEARLWLAVKSGPAAFFVRVARKLAKLWRLLTLFFCSPLAGEFSPVGLLLRLLGIAPSEDSAHSADVIFDNPLDPGARQTGAGRQLYTSGSNL
eukprot:Plantae.Rhodophyta-Palmaria_palmata.ctg9528.p1 GENE.Plantae.Rhodophyta-Palmaria_palmata.ctg9528~~Plantae.Rhodophyta-Palmaria_palmata.ctg9528.p1  ORF type:complete len:241 (+),score=23.99 Plantae.Rhodophyta-Palmaria_palmata.ctg9528:77-799(+)